MHNKIKHDDKVEEVEGVETVKVEYGLIAVIQSWFSFITTLALALLLLIGCQRSPSATAVLISVPDLQQQHTFDCGITAIRCLLEYYHVPVQPELYVKLDSQVTADLGAAGSTLKIFFEAHGFHCYIFSGSLENQNSQGLLYHLQQGRPMIVLLGNQKQQKHYVVVRGYEADLSTLYIMDPARGYKSLQMKDFLRLWQETKNFCLLAVPKP